MLRAPAGGVENVAEMKDVGRMEYVALNIGDWPVSDWALIKDRATALGVQVIPKARCYSVGIVDRLVLAAREWGSLGIIVNLEIEAKDSMPPSRVRGVLDDLAWDGEVGVSTEAHLYDYPLVEWVPLTGPKYTALLQIYPEDGRVHPENVPQWQATQVRHARASGYTYVGVTYQCWRSDPNWFDRRGTYSLAYGDDVAGTGGWGAWAPVG
jgi:hypothetical protein